MMALTNPLRFWANVQRYPGSDCWIWTGPIFQKSGYGEASFGGAKTRAAHKVAYEELIGPVPEGLVLDHLCRVRHCVNPAHLEPVTQRENTIRGVGPTALNAKKTHCHRGHALTLDNLDQPHNRRGIRKCKQCRLDREREQYRRMRETNPLPEVWRWQSLKTACGHLTHKNFYRRKAMQAYRNEEALVLTPETEQDRALLSALATAYAPESSGRTPQPSLPARTTLPVAQSAT